jgi:photosystem II stability/assembly factor-like uncharacterized protein
MSLNRIFFMKDKIFLIFFTILLVFSACMRRPLEQEKTTQSGSFQSIGEWFETRSFPDKRIVLKSYTKAFESEQSATRNQNNQPNWTSLGPDNIGGRTLCLAFHPGNDSIIYAGSASGGLWKTTTAGVGAAAWTRIPTGFPVLGVGAIAINPNDPEEMYIGTGEVYDYQNSGTGFTERTNRGTYGIGILKTSDGGLNWEKSLDWSYNELRGIQEIVINPLNTETVFAATTEGLYRSWDAGNSWQEVSGFRMAVDIELHPVDTAILYVTFGSYESAESGIYRSTDGGTTFSELTFGLPASYTGKSLMAISPSNPSILYASIADAFQSKGLYKSFDGGDHWTLVNDFNVAQYQGWYSHDVAIDPTNSNRILNGGIDIFQSSNGGTTLEEVTKWYEWYLGEVPAGTPEGPPNYVHADIHAIYFHPSSPQKVYVASDGGIFFSADGGHTYQGRNGGYQTQQFYANFSNSATDPNFAVGGMQDNASVLYKGNPSWYRIIGGDGMCTAMHPTNDSILFASTQNMGIRRSGNRGTYFTFSSPTQNFTDNSGFNAPFELSTVNPNIMYAGGQRLYKSSNNGVTWQNASGDMVDGGNPIVNIVISPFNPNKVLFSTFPRFTETAKVFLSTNAGLTRTQVTGLPNRIVMDITFNPADSNIVYAALSGYGTAHVYKSINGGSSWYAAGDGLPDVPVNSILIDPEFPDHIYVSNDISVYISKDGGITWENYGAGLTDAVLGMHLSLSPANNKIRLATHGNGVYEGNLFNPNLTFIAPDSLYLSVTNRNNLPLNEVGFRLMSQGDTLYGQSNNGIAGIDLPADIPLTPVVPDLPYPNEDNITYPLVQYQYHIDATRNTNPVAGVTTFDLLTIQKHILQIEPFVDPYQYLAADVSNNNIVTAQDLLLIRRLILIIDTAFANVPSWQFYPADYVFPDPGNAFEPEPMTKMFYNPYSPDNPAALKWLGIKSGDVNFSAQPFTAGEEERNGQQIMLQTDIQEVEDGYIVLVSPKEALEAFGFQFGLTLNMEAGSSLEVSPMGPLTTENFHYHADKAVLLVSWNEVSQVTFAAGQPILMLHIRKSGRLSPSLAIDKRYIQPEVYLKEGIAQLVLENIQAPTQGLLLSPNPVQDKTILSFELDKAIEVQFEITDMLGRPVWEQKSTGVKGRNSLELSLGFLPAGNYICLLRVGNEMRSVVLTRE